MERPDDTTIAYYDQGVPTDARAVKGQMFGHPCAFVNGHMFFGTFAQSVVVRVGMERAEELARGKIRIFEPMAGRAWREYIQIDTGSVPLAKLRAWATEALEATALLAPKVKKAAAKKAPASPKVAAAKKAPAAKKPR